MAWPPPPRRPHPPPHQAVPPMPLPKIGDALLDLVQRHVATTIGSDGVSGTLPDGRVVEINNVDIMLSRVATATSAQAVHAREFFNKVETLSRFQEMRVN